MNKMNGDYRSMAEACGEAPWQRAGYEPSHSWTSSELAEMHEDDLEGVMLVTARDQHRTMQRLEKENAQLRAALARATGVDPDELADHMAQGDLNDDGDDDYEGGEDSHLDAQYEDRYDLGTDDY